MKTIPYKTQHQRNRKRISTLIGRKLKTTEVVHTHIDGTLVVCESPSYHMLLHQRTEALEICGHASWRKCRYCKKYDDPTNLRIHIYSDKSYRSDGIYHLKCHREYMREYRKLHLKHLKF